MKSRTWYTIHKWLAISVGLFLLAWTVSGIVMMLPSRWFGPAFQEPMGAVAYEEVLVSPAQALAALNQARQPDVGALKIDIVTILDRAAYEIYLDNGSYHLVDASSGEEFSITSDLAERIVREKTGTNANVQNVERLNSHDLLYPFGELPVYRLDFAGDGSALYYVSVRGGKVSQSNLFSRARAAITSLHTFEPIKLFIDQDQVRKGLLVLTSGAGVLVAITGYYLALLPYIRIRSSKRHLK